MSSWKKVMKRYVIRIPEYTLRNSIFNAYGLLKITVGNGCESEGSMIDNL